MPADAAAKPVEHGLDHLVEGEAVLECAARGEADLGVDDAVGGQVLGALGGDPLDARRGLHHADGVVERLQVQHEVVALGAAVNQAARSSASVVGRPV